MKYCVISSGSKANCTLVSSKNTNILIDLGTTKKKCVEGLQACGLGLEDISCLLITHAHSDHIAGVKFIPREKWRMGPNTLTESFDESQYFYNYEEFQVGDLKITPLPLSHDKPNTSGFLIKSEGESLVYITDTGYVKDKVLDLIQDCTYYVFESNHDTKMLYTSNRTADLIKRIHSDKGHLDNIASASYLSALIGKDTKEITLAHLSEECNTPEIAEETFKKVIFEQKGKIPNLLLRCASAEVITKGGDYLLK